MPEKRCCNTHKLCIIHFDKTSYCVHINWWGKTSWFAITTPILSQCAGGSRGRWREGFLESQTGWVPGEAPQTSVQWDYGEDILQTLPHCSQHEMNCLEPPLAIQRVLHSRKLKFFVKTPFCIMYDENKHEKSSGDLHLKMKFKTQWCIWWLVLLAIAFFIIAPSVFVHSCSRFLATLCRLLKRKKITHTSHALHLLHKPHLL